MEKLEYGIAFEKANCKCLIAGKPDLPGTPKILCRYPVITLESI
jgi:hypothetical protein